jgi:transglutaminase-like putative cysteine protease
VLERARSWNGSDFAVFGLTEAALMAYATAQPGPWARALAFLDVAALFVLLVPWPPRWRGAIERLCWGLVFLAGGLALMAAVYPLLPAVVVSVLPRAVGHLLALLCVAFVSGRRQWDPLRTAAPAALGLFVIAALEARALLPFPLALAGASVVVGLSPPGSRGWLGRMLRSTTFAIAAAALAVAIVRLLPWAQPQVENAVAGMVAPREAASGFSLDSRLGEAAELTLSPRVLMHVTTNAATRLRARVYARFDGRAWRPDPLPTTPFVAEPGMIGGDLGAWLDGVPGDVFAAPGHGQDQAWSPNAVRTRVVQVAPVVGALPAPARPLLIRRIQPVVMDEFGVLGPPSRGLETYGVVSAPAERRVAPPDPSEDVPLLALPPDLDSRFVVLANRLASEAASPEARLARTIAHVQTECAYSLKPGPFRSDQPAAEFLFEKKKGYCEYFATATAVLLRLQGLPTRYVRGFTVREANRVGGHHVVREADAHAWLEVRLPGRGFVEADPTPAAAYDAAHGGLERGGLTAAMAWLSGRYLELRALIEAGAGFTVLARLVEVARSLVRGRPAFVTFGLGFLAAVWLFRRVSPIVQKLRERQKARRRASLPAAAPDLAALLLKTDRLWSRHGRRRPVFRAPLEHLASIEEGSLPRAVLEGTRRVVEAYYRGRFAGHPLTAGEVRQLDRALEALAAGKVR